MVYVVDSLTFLDPCAAIGIMNQTISTHHEDLIDQLLVHIHTGEADDHC